METYRDIVNEVASNTGLDLNVEAEKPKILIAIHWAETKMHRKSDAVNYIEKIYIDKDHYSYPLPRDFNTQREIVIVNPDLKRYQIQEVELNQIMRYEPQPGAEVIVIGDLAINPKFVKDTLQQTEDEARFYGKLLYAINRTSDGYEIVLKPRVKGIIFLYYSGLAEVPKEIDEQFSALPHGYWAGIAAGASWYILRRKLTELIQSKSFDANTLAVFQQNISSYKGEFEEELGDLEKENMKRAEPVVMKPWTWYDQPEEYIQG